MIKILIVEAQALLRDLLTNTLGEQKDMQVAGVVADADDALNLCRKIVPDLALIDAVTKNKANGIAAAAQIRRELPDVKIVIMTGLPEITFMSEARKAGAHSFVYKDSDSRHLLYVIRNTMDGQGVYPGPGNSALSTTRFTSVEIAVIRLVCQSKGRHEIAQDMAMSEGSIKAIITSILNKTGFDSIMKFAIYAVGHGFIMPDHGE